MDNFLNLLLDFCFYGFLDSIIMYLFITKLLINKKVEYKNIVKHCLIISFGISIITFLVPTFGLSQIFMGIYVGIIINRINKDNIFKSMLYGLIVILFVYCFEIIIYNIILNLFNFNSLAVNLNNIYRLLIFLICKIIETVIIWWCYKMKVVFGGIVRR